MQKKLSHFSLYECLRTFVRKDRLITREHEIYSAGLLMRANVIIELWPRVTNGNAMILILDLWWAVSYDITVNKGNHTFIYNIINLYFN